MLDAVRGKSADNFTTDATDFLSIYDEFKSLSIGKIQAAIEEAILFCPYEVWGVRHRSATYLITAHILTSRWLQVGTVAASAAQNAKGAAVNLNTSPDDWLLGTSWGKQFLQLRKGLPVTGFVV